MISLACKYCHKEFHVKPYRQHTAICCSRKCLWHITKYEREPLRLASITGKQAVNNKQITIKCKQCKTYILISPSRKNYTKFCSKSCYTAAAKLPKKSPYKRIYINGKRIHEHRYIMEIHLGRKLLPNEHVHHINHNHLDNRIENLEVLSASEHTKKHIRSY